MTRLGTALRGALLTIAIGAATLVGYACSGVEPTPPTENNNTSSGGTNESGGRISVWTDYTSPIAVTIDGNAVGSTSASYQTTPGCGESGTVTVTVAPGQHAIAGSANGHTWSGTTTVSAGQCALYQLNAPPAPPPTGQLSIWTDDANPISVFVDGQSVGTTSARFTSTPSCGATGTVTISLTPGTHTISGTSGTDSWNATETVVAGQCTLHKLAAPAPALGQLTVWTDYTSPIAVTVDGNSVGTLTSYFPTGAPTCGQAGTINVSLPAGTHSIAGSSGSLTWNSTATITAGQCTLFKLNAPAAPSTAQLSIWTDYSTQISVKVDGTPVGTLTTYFATGTPTCGQAGTLTVTVPAGTHTISGVSGTLTWNGSTTVSAGQCMLFKLNAPAGGGGGSGNVGQLSVWTDYSNQIAVNVDGTSVGTLTSYFPNGTPNCGQSGTITINVAAGTHSVSGISGSTTWNGTATVVAGQCTLFKLNAPSGGGGGGGGATGEISIWSNYPQQISVAVDGGSVGTLTSYFPSWTPNCGQSGTITVSRSVGSHYVSAVSGNLTWSGYVTVVSGQCTLYELRGP